MEIAYGTFICMNRICKKVHKHTASPQIEHKEKLGDPDVIYGYALGHACPFCGSLYMQWMNFEKEWECTEQTGWQWKRKILALTKDDNKAKLDVP